MNTQAMPAAELAAELAARLSEENLGYERMLELLREEEAALLEGAVERIAGLAGEKERLSVRLRDAAARRSAILTGSGLPGTEQGMREWLARHPGQSSGVQSEWQRLSARAEAARRQNGINGRLVTALAQHLQARLNLISAATCANGTYGPDGSTRFDRGPGRLVRV
ncbi:MAG: flagellar protein FlgN [Burkholderiales bacterium]|nr:flagellar protein FlgN [Burkholderiales bacterium]